MPPSIGIHKDPRMNAVVRFTEKPELGIETASRCYGSTIYDVVKTAKGMQPHSDAKKLVLEAFQKKVNQMEHDKKYRRAGMPDNKKNSNSTWVSKC